MSRPDLTITIYQAHTLALPHATSPQAKEAIRAAINIARYGRHAARRMACNLSADARLIRLARQLAAANAAD